MHRKGSTGHELANQLDCIPTEGTIDNSSRKPSSGGPGPKAGAASLLQRAGAASASAGLNSAREHRRTTNALDGKDA